MGKMPQTWISMSGQIMANAAISPNVPADAPTMASDGCMKKNRTENSAPPATDTR